LTHTHNFWFVGFSNYDFFYRMNNQSKPKYQGIAVDCLLILL
jgi:hypothetical protein